MAVIGVAIHDAGIEVGSWCASLYINEPTSVGVRDAIEELGTVPLKKKEKNNQNEK